MWPFDQPKNCATIVSKSILERGAPILIVCHDADDHGWQFLDGLSEDVDDLALIGLGHILDIDTGMAELAGLEPGYQASRQTTTSAWVIEQIPAESEGETPNME
ncbi:hypothetical protein [Undibacterium sp. TC9W]|uniref:hypothetical protein n=1 Tax=Undibacterium sp. TC9W TaxID=3413053 RepID=UPI003BF24FF1